MCSVPQSEMVPSSPASSPAVCIAWAKSRLNLGRVSRLVHPTPSPPVSFSAQLATQLCRITFERAGGREVKQMDSAYSACLLVSW